MDEEKEKIAPTVSIETVIVVRPMKVFLIFIICVLILTLLSQLTLLHSERAKLNRIFAVLSAKRIRNLYGFVCTLPCEVSALSSSLSSPQTLLRTDAPTSKKPIIIRLRLSAFKHDGQSLEYTVFYLLKLQ